MLKSLSIISLVFCLILVDCNNWTKDHTEGDKTSLKEDEAVGSNFDIYDFFI